MPEISFYLTLVYDSSLSLSSGDLAGMLSDTGQVSSSEFANGDIGELIKYISSSFLSDPTLRKITEGMHFMVDIKKNTLLFNQSNIEQINISKIA